MRVKMKETENDFLCSNGHMKEAITILLNQNLEINKRLLCQECVSNLEIDGRSIGIQKIITQIKDEQEKKIQILENIIHNQIKSIDSLVSVVADMKSKAQDLLQKISNLLQKWIENLQQQIQQYSEYSFYDQLEAKIQNQNKSDDNEELIAKEIMKINNSWTEKLRSSLRQFSEYSDVKCKEFLQSPVLCAQSLNQFEAQQLLQTGNQQGILEDGEIRFKLIDQSVKQGDTCRAIVFDFTGSIMISTSDNDIKVWKFLNGELQLQKTLEGHTDWIQCLVYSKKQNSFISVALDQTIRCWQQQNQNQWINSEPYCKHAGYIRCIILNLNEDLLFSGSEDKSIIVWKVDFQRNELTYNYSLDKHQNGVTALSLNNSENVLVSCAYDSNQIIIWERGKEQNKYEFKQLVKQSILDFGFQVKFIKENQFIWIAGGQKIDKLFIFEKNKEGFQESQTLQLLINNQIRDENCFPMIYNQKKNLIVIRHKTYIYIIRETNDGMFKIVNQLNCNTNDIYGSITNNGQYLVYWDAENEGYSTYELLFN